MAIFRLIDHDGSVYGLRMKTCARQCDANALAAYLFLHLGEQMPEDLSDEEFEQWALQPDPNKIDIARVRRFIHDLDVLVVSLRESSPDEYMAQFYEAAKLTFDGDKKMIRTWFLWLYLVMFQRPDGPRWGDFVQLYGVDNFVDKLHARLFDLSYKAT